jgi:predicted transcriptional regulator
LSIKPIYVRQIFAGTKTIEVRRRFPLHAVGARALIYSTTPDRVLAGSALIERVEELRPSTLWRRHRLSAGIAKRDFDEYLAGSESGFAIQLANALPLIRPFPLEELRSRFGFAPPQSYQYATRLLSGLVDGERAEALN